MTAQPANTQEQQATQERYSIPDQMRAAVLFGAVAALRTAFGTPVWPAERIEQERQREKVRDALGVGAWAAALAEGQDMTLEDAVAYALERAETDACARARTALRGTPTTSKAPVVRPGASAAVRGIASTGRSWPTTSARIPPRGSAANRSIRSPTRSSRTG